MRTALVSGASVAGLAVSYWLEQQAYSVTAVERYDGLRPGGQAIDVRGPALGILDRTGLLHAAEAKKTAIRGVSFVDKAPARHSSVPTSWLANSPAPATTTNVASPATRPRSAGTSNAPSDW